MTYPSYSAQKPSASVRPSIASSSWQLLKRSLVNFGKRAIAYFTQDREPIVSQRICANGQVVWTIHDPYTGQSTTCYSVAEVRAWLESRYSYRYNL
ncbi:hypothetical protein H6G89_31630 [Oscillatoria sp. FACHB-1407]|uniref:hypothetical protein n=1 Tax=Oscillatoria sp. FACHB-1407 TaxID=2692847 RepID=UPI00168A3DC8|nr:hypothetical protein [Oscillatoria sp. FACHB-1407]MBD2465546.1 hypothetical protein [Oscillatoria sp. FACHB-1407]